MVTTNYTKKRSWRRGYPSKSNKVVIADSTDDSVKEYVCSSCNRTRHTRQSKGELECLYCGEVINIEGTRRRSKLETPHQNTETLIADPKTLYGGNNPGKNISIKREPTYKGSFAELAKRVKFTSYEERGGSGGPIYEREDED